MQRQGVQMAGGWLISRRWSGIRVGAGSLWSFGCATLISKPSCPTWAVLPAAARCGSCGASQNAHKIELSSQSSSSSSSSSLSSSSRSSPSAQQEKMHTAVIRYDNNCATVPFVGSKEDAEKLRDRMTSQTHKHHVFLMETARFKVPVGPYKDLEDCRKALGLS